MEPPNLPAPPNPAELRLAQMPKMKPLLDQSIEPGEKVEILIVGAFNQMVVGTDRRIVVLKKGLMAGATFGHKLSSWEYRNVTGIQLDTRASSGILIIHAGGEEPIKSSYWASGKGSAQEAPNAITFASKPDADAQAGVAQLRKRVADAHAPQQSTVAPDPVEQLRKLGELRDSGVITPEEFESKKRDLLDRI
jgi:hypothetical protein